MFYRVSKSHVPKQDPIILKKGQHVIAGEEGQQWKNWVNCSTPDGCQQGWVPDQIIEEGNLLDRQEITVPNENE